MKRGFTLVELLAVIVILAVIALITIPAVMKMIDNATINSYRRSIDLYGKAVSQGIISYESDMVEKNKPINITFENIDSYIEYEGNDVDCKDKTIYSDRTILLTQCSVKEELVYAEKGRGYGEENYYYYTNSKKKMKLIKYIEAVEEAIQDKNISGTCTIGEDKITCNNEDITIKSKLENAIEGTLTIENNKVKSYSNMRFATEKKTETNNEVPQVIDEQNTSNNNTNNQTSTAICKSTTGTVSTELGTKYECEVKPGTKYNFYVLSVEGNNINLIMDRNICGSPDENLSSNGQIATSENPCLIAWHEGSDDNTYGPDTAMMGLYNGTKMWSNVPDMIMSSVDENNKTNMTCGYESIMTDKSTKITTIKGKQNKTSEYQIFGNLIEPLKARLARADEVMNVGCQTSQTYSTHYGTCPMWLVENLANSSIGCISCSNNYRGISMVNNIYGYWLLFSPSENENRAFNVDFYGYVDISYTSTTNRSGIRPVITVPISYLQ